jgi:hypothetical protein
MRYELQSNQSVRSNCAVRAEQQRLAQQQQAEQGERLKAHLAVEAQKLSEAIPELSDPAKGQAIKRRHSQATHRG